MKKVEKIKRLELEKRILELEKEILELKKNNGYYYYPACVPCPYPSRTGDFSPRYPSDCPVY